MLNLQEQFLICILPNVNFEHAFVTTSVKLFVLAMFFLMNVFDYAIILNVFTTLAKIYLFKVSNGNNRTMYEIC